MVQPGVVDGMDSAERRFDRGEQLTRELAGQGHRPGGVGREQRRCGSRERPDLAARIAALSRAVGADVLVNVDARREDGPGRAGIFKSSVLVGPHGPTGDSYDKMRLVPFGEYVPARSLLGWATSVGKAAGEDRLRGARQVVMTCCPAGRWRAAARAAGLLRVGVPRHEPAAGPRRRAAAGRPVVDLSFQQSWAPAQHASLAALRAAETGRPMVHATLTGVTAVYGPDGSRSAERLGTDSSGAVYDVPLAKGTTLYVRFGDWPVYGALAVLAALGAAEGARSLGRPAPGLAARPARTARGYAARPGR